MADGFFKKIKNLILGKDDTEAFVSQLKEFNNLTETYNNLLKEKIKQKQKSISNIRVMLDEFKPALLSKPSHELDIKLVDMKDTRVTKKGKGTSKKQMDWEKKFKEMSNQNRGVMI